MNWRRDSIYTHNTSHQKNIGRMREENQRPVKTHCERKRQKRNLTKFWSQWTWHLLHYICIISIILIISQCYIKSSQDSKGCIGSRCFQPFCFIVNPLRATQSRIYWPLWFSILRLVNAVKYRPIKYVYNIFLSLFSREALITKGWRLCIFLRFIQFTLNGRKILFIRKCYYT